MQTRPLGRTGLEIAPLVLGGNVFGWTLDEAASFDILDAFVEQGFNAIDNHDASSTWVPGNRGGESANNIVDRKSAVHGQRASGSVALGGRRNHKNKTKQKK